MHGEHENEDKPPKDKGKPADKETKIDDKSEPAKLLMEWPEVLNNLTDNEETQETHSSLQSLLASVFDGLFAQ